MSLWHLAVRELVHRKWGAALSLVSVSAAVACVVGAILLLRSGELETGRLLAAKEAEVRRAGADLEDAMRKITKGLGFNLLILPEDQDRHELNVDGTLSRTMPEEYVQRLANSKIVTVNHLLPTVMKKLRWPELDLSVWVYGTRGETPILRADPKKPILDLVPEGQMVVGYQVAKQRQLKPGTAVRLMGKEFNILKTHEERGTADDSTVWINLRQAQEMFGLQNLIHAILALECNCENDRLSVIREEIGGILPGTQVVERGPPALARAEARNKAKETAEASFHRERASRAELQAQRQRVAAMLVPLIFAGCGIWIVVLAIINARQRREEIGILRALGCRASQIVGLFMRRAMLIGGAGALAGFCSGWAVAAFGAGLGGRAFGILFDGRLFLLAAALALGLSILGMWLPALAASRQDAGKLIREEG